MKLQDHIEFFAKACAEITREVEEIAGEDVCPENFHGILQVFANNILEDEDIPKPSK